MTPDVTVAKNWSDFKSLVDAMRPFGIFRCDDPVNRYLGFVSYNNSTGTGTSFKAYVAYVSVTEMKMAPVDDPLHMEILIGLALRRRLL